MFGYNHKGYRWGIAFLVTDSRMTLKDRLDLIIRAIEMYLDKEDKRKIRNENYEGIIYTTNEHKLIGTFGGKQYTAEIETNYGKTNLRFLVAEPIDPSLN